MFTASTTVSSSMTTMMLCGAMLFALWMVASMLLRLSCMLNGAPRPRMVGASVLVLLVSGASLGVYAAMSMGLGMTTRGLGLAPEAAYRVLLMLGLPLHMLVAATGYRILLPTTFGRAMCVWIVQALALAVVLTAVGTALSIAAPQAWESLQSTVAM